MHWSTYILGSVGALGIWLLALFLLFRFRVSRPLNILDLLENPPASSARRRSRRRNHR